MAAYVAVHLALDIANQRLPERAALLWEYLYETRRQLLIIKQDEKHVKQRDERRHDADQHACRLPYHGKDFGRGVLYSLDHVLLLEEALYGLAVVTNPLLYGDGEVADVPSFRAGSAKAPR